MNIQDTFLVSQKGNLYMHVFNFILIFDHEGKGELGRHHAFEVLFLFYSRKQLLSASWSYRPGHPFSSSV